MRKKLTRIRDYFFYDTCAEFGTNLENIDSWLCLVEAEGNWNDVIDQVQRASESGVHEG